MRAKAEKKLVCFYNLPLIDKIVKDEAYVNGISESAALENHILCDILPENENARNWVRIFLYGECENRIQRTLMAVFDVAGSGINWEARWQNIEPFVLYAKNNSEIHGRPELPADKGHLHYLIDKLDSVSTRFEMLAQYGDNEYITVECNNMYGISMDFSKITSVEKMEFKREGEYVRSLINELNSEPEYTNILVVYSILLRHWNIFKGWAITYRLLLEIVKLTSSWNDSEEERLKLLQLLKMHSKEWD